jgi:UDP-3-O-[3-hydroxymyristoyl] glucosamine N-acyltransferase
MSTSIRDIVENFSELVHAVRVANQAQVDRLTAPDQADSSSLIFLTDRKHLKAALGSKSRAWVVHKSLVGQIPPEIETVLSTPNVALAMASIAQKYFRPKGHHRPVGDSDIHPSAIIASSAELGAGVIVGPGAVISENVKIGSGAIVGANTVIERGAQIGERTHLHPLVFIGHSCVIGADCEIHPHTTIGTEGYGYAQDAQFNHHRITHYGKVVIEDRVHIGAGVQIDRGTFQDSFIGSGTKIDNHCHFAHNIKIGKNSLITAGMIAAGSVTIGSYCVFGGRTSIAGHLSITDRANIAGLSGITKSVTEPGEYGGFPLTSLRDALKVRVATRNLPAMLKQIKLIASRLGLDASDLKGTNAE